MVPGTPGCLIAKPRDFSRHCRPADEHGLDRERLRRAVRAALAGHSLRRAQISLALVDDPTIARLNRQFLRHQGPTDVLSFLLEAGPGWLEGEVVVSAETARREAPRYGWHAARTSCCCTSSTARCTWPATTTARRPAGRGWPLVSRKSWGKYEIQNDKSQTNPKYEAQMLKKGDASRMMPWENAGLLAAVSVIGDFGNLILFEIWDLGFGISSPLQPIAPRRGARDVQPWFWIAVVLLLLVAGAWTLARFAPEAWQRHLPVVRLEGIQPPRADPRRP